MLWRFFGRSRNYGKPIQERDFLEVAAERRGSQSRAPGYGMHASDNADATRWLLEKDQPRFGSAKT